MFFNKKETIDEIENRVISDIKALSIDIIKAKQNSNIKLSLNLIPTLYTLYTRHLRYNSDNPKWLNRDRVVLASNTAYPALAAVLYMAGFDISLDDLKNPDKDLNEINGIDVFLDNQNEALSIATGIALGENKLDNFNKEVKKTVFDFNTYLICTDLDLIKGTSFETLSFINENKLKKLVIIYEHSKNTFVNKNKFELDPVKYFESLNMNTISVDKDNILEIDSALSRAKDSDKTTVIILNSESTQNKFEANYTELDYELSDDDITKYKSSIDSRDIPFTVSSETVAKFQEIVSNRMLNIIDNWNKIYDSLDEDYQNKFIKLIANDLSVENINIDCSLEETKSLPEIVSKILESLQKNNLFFIGEDIDYKFRNNIYSIQNGLSLVGLRNYSISNLSNVSSVLPSIKYAVKHQLDNIYIFNEDELNSDNILILRNIIGLNVYRPNDANEMIGTFKIIMNEKDKPSCIIVGKNLTTTKQITSINDVKKGGYIVKKEDKNISAIIVATGNELDIAIDVSITLKEKGYDIRIISMPSIELFNNQKATYKENLLPLGTKIFVIENSTSYSWYKFVYNDKYLITTDKVEWYKNEEELKEFKDKIVEKIETLLK